MMKLLVLLAAVTAVAAVGKTEGLLKRLLDVLEEEKRSMNVFSYDGTVLKVSYKGCVQGDKSTTPCKNRDGVKGHTLHIFDDADKEVATKSEKYLEGYGGPYSKYEDLKLKDGEHYEVWACESFPGEKKGDKDIEYECNKGDITGGVPKFGFGGRVFNPIENRVKNQNSINT